MNEIYFYSLILPIIYFIISSIIGAVIGGVIGDKISRINTIMREYNHIFQLLLNTNKSSITPDKLDFFQNHNIKNEFEELSGISKEDIKNSLKIITFEYNNSKVIDNFIYKNLQFAFEYLECFEAYFNGFPLNYGIYDDEYVCLKCNKYIPKNYLLQKMIKIKSNYVDFIYTNFYNTDFKKLINLFEDNNENEINQNIIKKLEKNENIIKHMKSIKHHITFFDVLKTKYTLSIKYFCIVIFILFCLISFIVL